ncbi:MAG TPA: DUF2865 domain-containing protein [Nitrobacter sp.]|nr:DUF2865 domain-containing protein [Nitrobacter sp.]
MRTDLRTGHSRRRLRVAAGILAVTATLAVAPRAASAEGLFDFLFGGLSSPPTHSQAASALADPFGVNESQPPSAPPRPAVSSTGRATAFCVRSCDGRYFPVPAKGGATPARMCQAFCPASPTKVFSGGSIDNAVAADGERYADSANAYAYRKALKPGCTCNGRDPAGLAPIDLSLDPTLRPGDLVATTDGLVAYSSVRVGMDQTAEFTPIADYPGLAPSLREQLSEMKVAPVAAETVPDGTAAAANRQIPSPASNVPKAAASQDKRASLD